MYGLNSLSGFSAVCAIAALSAVATTSAVAQSAQSTPSSSVGQTTAAKSAKRPLRDVSWIEGILRKEMTAGGFTWGTPAHMRVYKEENVLEMWLKKGARYEKFKDFKICKWSGKIGPKMQEGDEQSPEGVYSVTRKQLLSRTKNHRAVNLDFPNAYDKRVNRTGSYLQIHGGCGSVGCYAMTDRGIEEIYRILEASFDAGQARVSTHIFPFHLTKEKLEAKKTHKAFSYWSMLKPIYKSFRTTQTLPGVRVCGTRYLAPGDTPNPPEQCVPVWGESKTTLKTLAAKATSSAKPSTKKTRKRRKPTVRRIVVKCNLRLPSCKRWLANQRRKLASRGVRTGGVRQAGESYVRKGSTGAVSTGTNHAGTCCAQRGTRSPSSALRQ